MPAPILRLMSRLSIKSLLEIYFLFVFGVFAAAAILTVSSLLTLRESQDDVRNTGMPTVSKAYELLYEAEAVFGPTPRFADLTDSEPLHRVFEQLDGRIIRIGALLDTVQTLQTGRLATIVTRTRDNLADLDERQRRIREALTRRIDLQREVDTKLSVIRNQTTALQNLLTDDDSTTNTKQIELIQLDVLRAVGFLNEAPTDPPQASSTEARLRYLVALDRASGRSGLLPDYFGQAAREIIGRLRALAIGNSDVFDIAWNLRDINTRIDVLTRSYNSASRNLMMDARELIDHARSDIDTTFERGLERIQVHARILAVAAVTAFVLAALLGYGVLRSVTRRIDGLNNAMDAAANGGSLRIDTMGNDEIGHVARALQVFVSARNKAEERERQAREEAERASAAKSRFLAAASHDLRQPLQAITLFLAVLGDNAESDIQKSILAKTRRSVHSLSSILDRVLDLSKLEAGLIVPRRSPFQATELFERLAVEFAAIAETKRIDFRWVPCGVVVRSDPTILETILRNLLSNAIKFTESGRVLLGARRRGAGIEIEVWDTGVGIPLDQRTAVFEEFYQIGNEERDRTKGLGLGLSIVRRMSRLLNHPVRIQSEPGRHTLFSIRVPSDRAAGATRSTVADPVAARDENTAASGHNIVLIEDDTDVAEATVTLMRGWGYRVTSICCTRDIRKNLAKYLDDLDAPDLIVADYRLPFGQTGAEAVEDLRRHFQRAVPALLITGDINPARLADAAATRLPLMHKPIHPDKLRTHIERLLRDDAASSSRAGPAISLPGHA